jgi:hypothetical protein
MKFLGFREAKVVAYELGKSTSAIERECVSAVSQSLGLFSTNEGEDANEPKDEINIGDLAQKLQRSIKSLKGCDLGDMLQNDEVINPDRFYMDHPSEHFYSSLNWTSSTQPPSCINCKTILGLSFKMCQPCFNLFRQRLEHSQPSDFGSIGHWKDDHHNAKSGNIFDEEEWFLSWNDFKSSFVRTTTLYMETCNIHHHTSQILIPGNGRSLLPFEIARLNKFNSIIVADAVADICVDMEKLYHSSSSICSDFNTDSTCDDVYHCHPSLTHDTIIRFIQDDATMSTFGDNQFDMILDKGLLDALACCFGSIENNMSTTHQNLKQTKLSLGIDEYHRLLKANGLLVLISGRDRSLVLKDFLLTLKTSNTSTTSSWVLISETQFCSSQVVEFDIDNNTASASSSTSPNWGCGYYVFKCVKH